MGPGCLTSRWPTAPPWQTCRRSIGATCGYFPIDAITLDYLRGTGRDEAQVGLVEAYAKAQGLFRTDDTPDPEYTDVLHLDLGDVESSLSGPRRPHDRVALTDMKRSFRSAFPDQTAGANGNIPLDSETEIEGETHKIGHGAVVIAAITSCTNTSNPSVVVGAGLLAKKAVEKGLSSKPWVKTSLAPGSQVVTDYLAAAGLTPSLEALGFHTVGYGCTTCIGNSGPVPEPVATATTDDDLVAVSVLSGNRNFEGRIHPLIKANYLASPMLVVAYAIAGTVDVDLSDDPLGEGADGQPVYPSRHLAVADGDSGDDSAVAEPGDVPRAIQHDHGGVGRVEGGSRAHGRPIRVGPGLHLHPRGAVLPGPGDGR